MPSFASGANATSVKKRMKQKKAEMIRKSKPLRDSRGNIVKDAEFCKQKPEVEIAKVKSGRKMFGNIRTISVKNMAKLKEDYKTITKDPRSILLKPAAIPFSLLTCKPSVSNRRKLLNYEKFSEVFGKESKRKIPKLKYETMNDMMMCIKSEKKTASFEKEAVSKAPADYRSTVVRRGKSKRLWGELYKVLDSSDVILHVLDARNPLGTKCDKVEDLLTNEMKRKHRIYLLNKCDLVPKSNLIEWMTYFRTLGPVLAFHASQSHPFGKKELLGLLLQYRRLLGKNQISVGLIGFPNVGKSSIINTLRAKKVCSVAPIPGETKVWQIIKLTGRINLIDCPGVVMASPGTVFGEEAHISAILSGAIQISGVEYPEECIPSILRIVKPKDLMKVYGLSDLGRNEEMFVEGVARRLGMLLPKGEFDTFRAARTIVNDFVRGVLPFITNPPGGISDDRTQDANKTPALMPSIDIRLVESGPDESQECFNRVSS